jgi:hypothetical protein
MNTTKSLSDLSITELQDAINKMSAREKQERANGQTDRADAFKKAFDNFCVELASRTEKKNEIEQPAEPTEAAGQDRQRAESSNTPVNTTDNISPVTVQDNANMKEHFKFVSKDAFETFDKLRRQLNQYLRNWVIKKKESKEPFHYKEIVVKVQFVLGEIDKVIEKEGRNEFKQVIRETTYLIGIKDDKRRYGFNFDELRKDFEF